MPEDPGRHAGAMPAIDGDIILKGICDTKAGRLVEGLWKARGRLVVYITVVNIHIYIYICIYIYIYIYMTAVCNACGPMPSSE